MTRFFQFAQSSLPPWLLAATAVLFGAVVLYGLIALAFRTRLGAWLCYLLATMFSRFFFHWKCENECPIPEHGPAIVVANHTSPVDPVILWIRHFANFKRRRLRVIGYLTAREYCNMWGPVGWICTAMQSIPVARAGRDMAPVKTALERLQEGRLMGLFPEGRINTKSPSGKLLRPGTGAAWLALKSRAPVIPIYIRDSPRSDSMAKCFLVQTQTTVVYGKPIDLSPWLDEKPTRVLLAEVTNHIMAELARLGGVEFTALSADPADHDSEHDESAHDEEQRSSPAAEGTA